MHRHTLGTSSGALVLAALTLAAAPATATTPWSHDMTLDSGGWNIEQYPRTLADVNGDGLDDLVGFGWAGVYVALSNGAGFGPSEPWLWGELALGAGGWNTEDYTRTTGDVNGDGRDDLIGFGYGGTVVALSNGSGFDWPTPWLHDFGAMQGWHPQTHDRVVGDVDGDGLDDIVGFSADAIYVSRSRGYDFDAGAYWGDQNVPLFGSVIEHSRQLGDVDGDGRADVIAFISGGAIVMRSTGAGFEPPYMALYDMGTLYLGGTAEAPRRVGDIDGDGRADLAVFVDGGVRVALSEGRLFGAPHNRLDTYGALTGWAPRHERVVGDIDGDERADVVGFDDDAVRVALSASGRFEDRFDPLSGGDFVTRFVQPLHGLCLSTEYDKLRHRPCSGDHPLGWTLIDRGDGTYDVGQDGKCLQAEDSGNTLDRIWAETTACGHAAAAWFVERDRVGMARLRNRRNGKCLRVPGFFSSDGQELYTMDCDASDAFLWEADTLRPREMTTTLRAEHSGKCLEPYGPGASPIVQRTCDDEPQQRFTFVDDGHGTYRIRVGASDLCLTVGSLDPGHIVHTTACVDGNPWQAFALRDLGAGQRLLVSRHSGHCVDVTGGATADGAGVISWGCHDGPNQRWVMAEMQASAAVQYSLQNVGGEGGTRLVIATGSGVYATTDPAAIVAVARAHGQIIDEASFLALLSPAQQDAFAVSVGAWDVELPGDVTVGAEMISLSGEYAVGLDGVDIGLQATLMTYPVEVGGVMRFEGRVLTANAEISVGPDGLTFGPSADVIAGTAGFGDPDGTYAGIGGGIGSRGFSVGARWGQNGQYGMTVPLGVVAVDLYVTSDDLLTGALFTAEVGHWMAGATIDAFTSAWGWTAGAFGTATDAIEDFAGEVGEAFEDVGDAVEDVFCAIFC